MSDIVYSNHLLNNLKAIELRTWNKFFAKERKRFSKVMLVVDKLRAKVLAKVSSQQSLNESEEHLIVNLPVYKEAVEGLDLKAYQEDAKFQKIVVAFREFYPQFITNYLLEIVNDEDLWVIDKINALNLIRDSIEKDSLLFNIDLFTDFRVALNYIAEKLPQLKLQQEEIVRVHNAIKDQLNAEDHYYWPLHISTAAAFLTALESNKLIKPYQKRYGAFQEEFDPEKQIEWIGQNKQLIYLLFLLYKRQRSFKGQRIEVLACHVFKQNPELQPRSLNNQLLKIINPNNNTVRPTMIDDSLRLIEELMAPFIR